MKVCERSSMQLSFFFFFSSTFVAWLVILGDTIYIYHNDIFVQQDCALKINKNPKCKYAFLLLLMDLHRHE